MNLSARRLMTSGFTYWMVGLAICLYMVYPLRQKLRFGIDLVGGSYITLEVQTDEALKGELAERMQGINAFLQAAGKPVPSSKSIINTATEQKPNYEIVANFATAQDAQEAAQELREFDTHLSQKIEGSTVHLYFSEARARMLKDAAVQANIDVLNKRLSPLSVAEIYIARQGERNIIIELPDVADPLQAKAMIGKPAVLEFKLVEKIGRTKEDIYYEYGGDLPDDMQVITGKEGRAGDKTYYLVSKFTDITGKMLRDARPALGGQTQAMPVVAFKFSPEGGEKFYELTSKNFGRQLAVVLDGEVITAPTINAAIRTDGVIEGRFNADQAKELSNLLKSGAFVAPVKFEEERQVGPGLGAEAIYRGLLSCLVGLGILFLFSVYYYSLSGLFAFAVLLYNLALILVGIAAIKATLTLPGIAGMVLTIGMAVDASILIYERIKEELAAGNSIKKSVEDGFSDAMVVILDANITTFIVGAVLYKFGTGPVQGFAVTMMLGIISTLITGLFFLRSIFRFYLNTFNVQKLRI